MGPMKRNRLAWTLSALVLGASPAQAGVFAALNATTLVGPLNSVAIRQDAADGSAVASGSDWAWAAINTAAVWGPAASVHVEQRAQRSVAIATISNVTVPIQSGVGRGISAIASANGQAHALARINRL